VSKCSKTFPILTIRKKQQKPLNLRALLLEDDRNA